MEQPRSPCCWETRERPSSSEEAAARAYPSAGGPAFSYLQCGGVLLIAGVAAEVFDSAGPSAAAGVAADLVGSVVVAVVVVYSFPSGGEGEGKEREKEEFVFSLTKTSGKKSTFKKLKKEGVVCVRVRLEPL